MRGRNLLLILLRNKALIINTQRLLFHGHICVILRCNVDFQVRRHLLLTDVIFIGGLLLLLVKLDNFIDFIAYFARGNDLLLYVGAGRA